MVGGAEVHGAEHPQFTAGLQVGVEHRLQQPQATPLDEGTEQIDPIRRRNHRLQRQPHTRFIGRIHQQSAIRQGNQRPLQRRLLLQQGHQPIHQRQLPLLLFGLRHCGQGDLAELPQVPGQPLGGFGGVQGRELVQLRRKLGKGLVGGLAEGVVVEAWG